MMAARRLNEPSGDPKPATVSQAGEQRDASLESLRALAALSVFGVHAFLASQQSAPTLVEKILVGGSFGVFFFFVLSGYLLFRPFVRSSIDRSRSVDLGRYGMNRALRILPLYLVAVTVLLALEVNGGSIDQWWQFALFLENFSEETVLRADSPMWSLAVEVHFYLLLPLLALGLTWVADGSRRIAAIAVLCLAVLSLFLRFETVMSEPAPDFKWTFSVLTLFYFFAAGMLLAVAQLEWPDVVPYWFPGRLASADLWIAASVPLWAAAIYDPRWAEPAVALASVLLIGTVVLPLRPGRIRALLEWRPLGLLGVASFSLYLWHVPVLALLTGSETMFDSNNVATTAGDGMNLLLVFAVGLPMCVVAALLSYAIIEAPFLRLRGRWTRSSNKPTA